MTGPNIQFELDLTGNNPNNLVTNESHILDSSYPIRILLPNNGAFYSNSVILKDNVSQAILNVSQYQITELFQNLTIETGLEICGVILIIDSSVSSNVSITYQAVGGYLQTNLNTLLQNYLALNSSDRNVDWDWIINKPYQFTPALHNQLLNTIYGFDPIINVLGRIRNAITISNIPAFEAVINYVNSKFASSSTLATNTDIDNVVSNNDVLTMNTLLYASQNLNFNIFQLTSLVSNLEANNSNTYTLFCSNISDNYTCYWSIEHLTTTNLDFLVTSGELTIVNKTATFNINALNPLSSTPYPKKFRILINKTTNPNSTLFTSGILNIIGGLFTSLSIGTQILKIINARYFGNPTIPRNALSASITSVINYPDNFQ